MYFLELPSRCLASFVWHVGFQELQHLNRKSLQLVTACCSQTKLAIPSQTSQVNLNEPFAGLLDEGQLVQWRFRGCLANPHVDVSHLGYVTYYITCYVLHKGTVPTSGAMRSLRRKCSISRRILTLSPICYLPVCLFTYIS